MNKGTKERYDAFIRHYHQNGNNGTQAATDAGYSPKTARFQANKLLTIPYIQDELKRLQSKAVETSEITLEIRLNNLQRVIDAGLETYIHNSFQEVVPDNSKEAEEGATKIINTKILRYQNLPAVVSAVREQNIMLGTTEENEKGESMAISFSVKDSVGEVKITNARA